jgi:GT2 family glycosyltransferase
MSYFPKVFVVILNWNGKDGLIDCLRSVFSLSYRNFEVIVVDNASRDGSIETAKASFSRAHFILNPENLGFSSGMNVGIRFALSQGAEYVWLLNNDTECERESLSNLVSVSESEKEPALYSPKILSPDGSVWFSGGKINYLHMRAEHVGGVLRKGAGKGVKSYETGYLSGCALFLPRKAIEIVGMLDEEYFLYYEDVDFSVRAKKKGFDTRIVPESVVVHREKSLENPEKTYWLVRSGLRFFEEHTPGILKPFMWTYLFFRRIKNKADVFRGKKEALSVSSAYADFDAT